jgi:hypothetical protein
VGTVDPTVADRHPRGERGVHLGQTVEATPSQDVLAADVPLPRLYSST